MKLNKTKIILFLIVVFALIGTIIYFVYANNKEDKPEDIEIKYEKINMITNFRLGVSNFDHINPHITQNKDIIQISSLIYEPLLEVTKDYKITNCLATEWSKVEEKSYVIKLNENVKWQDGTEFTAEDVKFTIEAIQKDKKSIYLENVKDIKKVEILDPYTVRIELNKEIPFFEYQLIFPILSNKQYKNENISKANITPIGTGRYKISKSSKSEIELIKNEEWHKIEKENPQIKTITISLYATMGEVYNAFRLSNIDLVHTSNTNYEKYIGSMGYQQKQYVGREYDYLAFNCENSVLKQTEVRQAIQKVIDKEEIISTALEKRGYKANFPIDYGHYLLEGIQFNNTPNKEEASQILKDAGWNYEYGIWSKEIDGRTRTLNFDLYVNKSNKQRVKVAEVVRTQLKGIGIQVNIKELSDSSYQRILKNHQYEIILTGVYNGYSPELNSFLGSDNLANYKNKEIEDILKEISSITSEDLLKERYKKIVDIYQREVPYIGLYRNQVIVAYGQSVRGDITPNNYSIFYQFSDWYRQ